MDWVYIDNLTHALHLGAQALLNKSTTTHIPSTSTLNRNLTPSRTLGPCYFINDNHPINNFIFLAQLCHGLGYHDVFTLRVPMLFMFYVAWIIEFLHRWISPIIPFAPFVTRAEVLKVSVTHYFSTAKAKKELGYEPIVSMKVAMERCVHFYSERGYRKKEAGKQWKWMWQIISIGLAMWAYAYLWGRK